MQIVIFLIMISMLTQFSHISMAGNMIEQNPSIIMYVTGYCPYCVKAKELFERKGLQYTQIDVEEDDLLRDEMISKSSGRRTVPQIFINDVHIGGCDDLYDLERSGKLDQIINGA